MKPRIAIALSAAIVLLVAGCGRGGSSSDTSSASRSAAVSGDFGDLKNVCQAGKVSSAPAQGVTAGEIRVGVFSDVGFTQNPELVDAAKVFTAWCNDAGGINGRKLVTDLRDTQMMQVQQRMLESCKQDFALVGGSAALDGMATKQRLQCLLPDFTAQADMIQAAGSDLQVQAMGATNAAYNIYQGFDAWLLKQAYPASASALGIINGDSPITKGVGAQRAEGLQAAGGKIAYNALYPVAGVSDWTPYAQAIKSKGVKGLVFYGDWRQLVKLEQALTDMNYKLDWIDPNNNAYTKAFIQLAGRALSFQNNLVDLLGIAPLEDASTVPAVKRLQDLYAQYDPKGVVTLPTLRAFSSWLLFAKAAGSCGDALTRKCLYDAARTEKAWTGGGLQAPNDLTRADAPPACFNVEKATPQGWTPVSSVNPDTGPYRCGGVPIYKLKGNYGKPLTLADVGKSLNDLK